MNDDTYALIPSLISLKYLLHDGDLVIVRWTGIANADVKARDGIEEVMFFE